MKALQKFPILVFLILFSSLALTAQTDQHYEYAEILVLQKVNNGQSDVKTIYLNSMSQEAGLDEAEINKIENTAELFSVLDKKGWFLFDRNSSQPSNSGPIWINMIFRKKK
ncbi:MAG: hypothetical protein JJE55_08000 [Flavobacteriaceae bacterium]|nr:hypothetical protein [Flavobacteriaceae bacterium]